MVAEVTGVEGKIMSGSYKCEKCGAKRIKVHGYVCPNGHGKIHYPALRKRGRPRHDVPEAVRAGYPLVGIKTPMLWMIVGTEGYFRRLESWLLVDGSKHVTPGEPVRARDNGYVRKFVPYEAKAEK